MTAPDATDDFVVPVRGYVITDLPNGWQVYIASLRTYEARGFTSTDGPVVEIVGYRSSGRGIDTSAAHSPDAAAGSGATGAASP